MKKVLLTSPPPRARSPRPPLGLMYISAYLEKEGIDNEIIDIKSQEPEDIILEKTIEEIKKYDFDIIGINCMCTEVAVVKEIANQIKKIKPSAKVVLGGPHPTSHSEQFLDAYKFIDYIVIGEGEITFTELVKSIRENKNISKVKGIVRLTKTRVVRNKPRELMQNLDELPFPAYHKVDMKMYTRPSSWGSRPILLSLFWVFTSRGCPYRCKFCVAHTLFGRGIRQRSVNNVVDEIELLKNKYKIDGIFIYDESFTVNRERVIAICKEIIKRKLNIVWGCQTRVNLINEDILPWMRKAGCLQVDFGIESGNQRVLNYIQKDQSVTQIKKAVKLCQKYELRVFANFMCNLPTETEKELNDSVKLAKELNCNVVIWNVFVPYPGIGFAKELILEDYETMNGFPSDEAYQLLETKYKFAKYKTNLKKLVDKLYKRFPHPRYFHFKLSKDYIKRWIKFISFAYDPKYILAVLRSKRKLQYLYSLLFQPMRK